MVKRVAMFKAEDGSLFPSEKEAREHEEFAKNSTAAKAALTIMGFETENGENGDLLDVVIKNRQAIIDALSGKAGKPRKPRTPKAKAGAAPVAEAKKEVIKPTPEGLDEIVSDLDSITEVNEPDETKEVAPEEKPEAVVPEVGAGDDDLDALMATLNA